LSSKIPILTFNGINKIACGVYNSYMVGSTCFGKNASSSMCSGRGICTDLDKCSCESKYNGNECQFVYCFQISSGNNSVCSGNGNCISSDVCDCRYGYAGENCQMFVCNGTASNMTSVCNSAGSCIGVDTCNCTLRNLGNNCEFNISFINLFNFSENYSIYASSNTIFFNESGIFTMKFEIDLLPILQQNLECRFGNQSFKATTIGNRFVQCNLSIQNEVNLWYSGNQTVQISNNFIILKRFKTNNISFNCQSHQIGNSYKFETVIVDLNPSSFNNFEGRIKCALNSTIFNSFYNQSSYYCDIYSEIGGITQLELYYLVPNAFLINNTNGVFKDKLSIEMKFSGQLNQNSLVELKLNTKDMIGRNMLKNDCSDLVVIYNNTIIQRNVLDCNTNFSKITFYIQKSILSSSNDYSIYYGNEDHHQFNLIIDDTVSNVNISIIDYTSTLIPISTNKLSYIVVPKVELMDISPKSSLLESTTVILTSNISFPEYFNLLSFHLFDGVNLFNAAMNVNKFTSSINSNSSRISNLTVRAVYKLTNETVIVSFSSFFQFWSTLIYY
jgi:hypothetical protein